MNILSFQPAYPHRPQEMSQLVQWLCDALDGCDDTADLIVLPESCNAMAGFASREEFLACAARNEGVLDNKAKATALRCGAAVAINLYVNHGDNVRNVTRLYDRRGHVAGEYLKQHLAQTEITDWRIDRGYTFLPREPLLLDLDGVRYGFLTCYDLYFAEYIQRIAAEKPDVLIVPALQRGERRDILAMQMQYAAFTCNAFAVRASVSMGGPEHPFGASTMVVSPRGEVLAQMGQQVGVCRCRIDPAAKHFRADSYGRPPIPNDHFIAKGRTPWAYSAAGPATRPPDASLAYPRVCAWGGFGAAAPLGTLPAIGAAVALGADEIALEILRTADGRWVVAMEETLALEGLSAQDVRGMVWDTLRGVDMGRAFSPAHAGLGPALLEDILGRFAGQVIFRLHSEHADAAGMEALARLITATGMAGHVILSGGEDVLRLAAAAAPGIARAACGPDALHLGAAYHCGHAVLAPAAQTAATTAKAHAAGIWCAGRVDSPAEVPGLLGRGVDTIITNNLLGVMAALTSASSIE